MKHKSPNHEAGLIQRPAKLASPNAGATTMKQAQNQTKTNPWLTPDHQAVLATIARWFDDIDHAENQTFQLPQHEEEKA